MTVKELIIELLNHCDVNDEVFIGIQNQDAEMYELTYYSLDGLENRHYEYRNKPTLSCLKVK